MTILIVPDEATEVEYTIGPSSSTGPFTIPFSFLIADDIRVSYQDSAGVITDLVNVTDFTVNGTAVDGGFDGGDLTLLAGVADVTLKVFRDTVIDRLTNIPEQGPFKIDQLNNELNKITTILQELEKQKLNYLSLPSNVLDATDWDLSLRAACNAGESADDDCLATNRQVDANGPNWLEDNDTENAVGATDVWNTIASQAAIKIEGNDTTKFFDLKTDFFCILQNRDAQQAFFKIRYRYHVDCYTEVAKESSQTFLTRIGGNESIPFHFMDIAEDIDYTNGNCTLSVFVDIQGVGSDSASLWTQWRNFAVNTSEPR